MSTKNYEFLDPTGKENMITYLPSGESFTICEGLRKKLFSGSFYDVVSSPLDCHLVVQVQRNIENYAIVTFDGTIVEENFVMSETALARLNKIFQTSVD